MGPIDRRVVKDGEGRLVAEQVTRMVGGIEESESTAFYPEGNLAFRIIERPSPSGGVITISQDVRTGYETVHYQG